MENSQRLELFFSQPNDELFNDQTNSEIHQTIDGFMETLVTSYKRAFTNLGFIVNANFVNFNNYKDVVLKRVGTAPSNVICANFCDGSEIDGFIGKTFGKFLEDEGYTWIGSSHKLIEQTSSKKVSKEKFLKNNVPTAPYVSITEWSVQCKDEIIQKLNFPLIIKLDSFYGSIGLTNNSVVKTIEECEIQTKYMLDTYKSPLIIEEYISGYEYAVFVYCNPDGSMSSYPTYKVHFNQKQPELEQFKTFEYKYQNYSDINDLDINSYFFDKIDQQLDQKIRNIAEKACNALDLNFYARVDIRQNKYTNQIYVLEVNDYPMLIADSCGAIILKYCQVSFEQLFSKMILLVKPSIKSLK